MGIYLKDGIYYESPIHTVHSLEAVGAGDAFAGGLLHAYMNGYEAAGADRFFNCGECAEADDSAGF